MPITIIMPDGAKYVPIRKGEPMTNESKHEVVAAPVESTRSIATVAAELEAALLASTRVKALREELEGLLGKRRRTKKGA